ncbi:ATP-binding protein [Streptomyces piniterrae]|uniref:ATP-binding protein n=1 Tax=Streptomyces piniterrae TaxID=2571125 RepID=UPI001FEC6849|nr:ATP-binding protein [Streptomyces piniterrae]
MVRRAPSPIQEWCKGSGNACQTVYSSLSPFLALGLAASIFLIFQYRKGRKPISDAAKKNPRKLVPTAGTTIDEVVGRKELCLVIARALRGRDVRRPYLLVGGVGTGKTAVLVQLTRMLAKKGAVPVPIRLRDADVDGAKLDFGEMAKKRFCEEVDRGVLSRLHSERVWSQLCMDDKAVIIADGLEETFSEGEKQKDRDILIRHAIGRAEKQNLPLVIASRPHSPLEDSQAAIIDLEPLSEEAALEYLQKGTPDSNGHRLDWIVETAAVTESPLYLQIAHQLRQHHLLEHLTRGKEWAQLDTRCHDRLTLRLRLLETWRKAIIQGHLHGDLALTTEEREHTVEVMSALACIGLLQDKLEVRFEDLIGPEGEGCGRPTEGASSDPGDSAHQEPPFAGIRKALAEKFKDYPETNRNRCITLLSLYATQGEQLGLVEAHGERVRFPHSVLQAYLGSAYLDASLRGSVNASLMKEAGPGRELLIALALQSRTAPGESQEQVAQQLLDAAEARNDAKSFEIYGAALQVDRAAGGSQHQQIADSLSRRWPDIKAGDRRTLDEAKEALVKVFGETLRAIAEAGSEDPVHGIQPAYDQFFMLGTLEPSYPIRLGIAQEMGAGGDEAFETLRKRFPLPERNAPDRDDPWVQYEEEFRQQRDEERKERERLLQRVSDGDGQEEREQYLDHKRRNDERRSKIWRTFVMRAWLVPMMVGSVSVKHRGQAEERLRCWIQHLEPEHSSRNRAELPISLEIALAQGFKSAANRRKRHPNASTEARNYLVEQAENMLAHARFWYSQLTLIHALCLWELPDRDKGSTTDRNADMRVSSGSASLKDDQKDSSHRPTADPAQVVGRWLAMAGSKRDLHAAHVGDRTPKGDRLHPFVAEAADFATLALETGHPERFIWIDEKGTVDKVGSRAADPRAYRKHNLWIPPSTGWSTLHPRAQQLLADVLLLLNLTERTGQPDELELRLERANRYALPPCMTKDRAPLQPGRTVGMAEIAPPGTTCLPDCPFELCPYPAKGEQPRAELRETFCRQQQALLRRYSWWNFLSWLRRKRAPWQGMARAELSRFWEEMAKRSRTRSS